MPSRFTGLQVQESMKKSPSPLNYVIHKWERDAKN